MPSTVAQHWHNNWQKKNKSVLKPDDQTCLKKGNSQKETPEKMRLDF